MLGLGPRPYGMTMHTIQVTLTHSYGSTGLKIGTHTRVQGKCVINPTYLAASLSESEYYPIDNKKKAQH